jgi:Arc/MetJ-type ribon-helix-helix transcriptional regulator
MTTVQVPTRFSEDEIAALDQLVNEGIGANRSEVIRIAFHNLVEWNRRRRIGEAIAQSYRDVPQTDEEVEWALANAYALTEAESW